MHRLAPPTIAASHSPFRIAVNALSNAYRELLHAVSMRNDGPVNPNEYEIRFANIALLHLWSRIQKAFRCHPFQ